MQLCTWFKYRRVFQRNVGSIWWGLSSLSFRQNCRTQVFTIPAAMFRSRRSTTHRTLIERCYPRISWWLFSSLKKTIILYLVKKFETFMVIFTGGRRRVFFKKTILYISFPDNPFNIEFASKALKKHKLL